MSVPELTTEAHEGANSALPDRDRQTTHFTSPSQRRPSCPVPEQVISAMRSPSLSRLMNESLLSVCIRVSSSSCLVFQCTPTKDKGRRGWRRMTVTARCHQQIFPLPLLSPPCTRLSLLGHLAPSHLQPSPPTPPTLRRRQSAQPYRQGILSPIHLIACLLLKLSGAGAFLSDE